MAHNQLKSHGSFKGNDIRPNLQTETERVLEDDIQPTSSLHPHLERRRLAVYIHPQRRHILRYRGSLYDMHDITSVPELAQLDACHTLTVGETYRYGLHL